MRTLKLNVLLLLYYLPTFIVSANWTGNITLANDYLFNGISQTQGKMATQAGITWAADNGFYLSSWASNIDYNQQANVEVDGYIGYFHTFSQSVSADFGFSQYTYHGSNSSSDLNFPESYMKWQLNNSQINVWYTWDYFGFGARNFIIMASHTFQVSDQVSIAISLDKSRSLDKDKWVFQPHDKDYIHGQISGHFSFHQFDFSIALHGTDLDDIGETRLLFSVSRSFGGE